MIAIIERTRYGSRLGYSRMNGIGMFVRPGESFFKGQHNTAQQTSIFGGHLSNPTTYMTVCLITDIFVWMLIGFIIYRVIQICRRAHVSEEFQKLWDKYDRLEADYDLCDPNGDDYNESPPSIKWIPAVFLSDRKPHNPSEVRKFHLPEMVTLTRWHSVPTFAGINTSFVNELNETT